MTTETVQFRTCPLCEATCGLEITVRDGRVHRIEPPASALVGPTLGGQADPVAPPSVPARRPISCPPRMCATA